MATPPSLAHVNAALQTGLNNAVPYEARLRNAYHRTLNTLVRNAAQRFGRAASHHGLTAASSSPWPMPDRDEVLNVRDAHEQLLEATQPTRVSMLSTMMGPALATVSATFTTTNPLTHHVLANMGSRITEITDLTRDEIMASLTDSHDQGLSIPHAARALSRDVRATNVVRSTLIARTEIIGARNGASLAAVRITGAAQYKQWLATNDAKTRFDHAAANGQVVPVSGTFTVGGYSMGYPGDQNAPAREVCNCRCTLIYRDSP